MIEFKKYSNFGRFLLALVTAGFLLTHGEGAAAQIPHPVSDPVTLGSIAAGRLEDGDERFLDGAFVDYFRFQALRGEVVTLRVDSSEVDAFLILLDETLNALAVDDNSGGGTNALIEEMELPVTGTYLIGVSARVVDSQAGAYTLTTSSVLPDPKPPGQLLVSPSEISAGLPASITLRAFLPNGRDSLLNDSVFLDGVDIDLSLLPLLSFADEANGTVAISLGPIEPSDGAESVLEWRVVTDDEVLSTTLTVLRAAPE